MTNNFNEFDFSALHPNFYNIDKEFLLSYKSLNERLSIFFLGEDERTDKQWDEDRVRLITKTSYNLFKLLTNENDYNVEFDFKTTNAYCELTNNKVSIGLNSLFNPAVPKLISCDTIKSTIFHEYYHKKYTITELWKYFKIDGDYKPYDNEFYNDAIKKLLDIKGFRFVHNILEDRRIEALGANEFPGNVFYFEEARKEFFYHYSFVVLAFPSNVIPIEYLKIKILLPEFLPEFFLRMQDNFNQCLNYYKKIAVIKKDENSDIAKQYIQELEIDTSSLDFILKDDVIAEKDIIDSYNKTNAIINQLENYIDTHTDLIYSLDFKDIVEQTFEILKLLPEETKNELDNKTNSKQVLENEDIDIPEEIKKNLKKVINDEIKKTLQEEKENEEKEPKIEVIKGDGSDYSTVNFKKSFSSEIDVNILTEANKISKKFSEKMGFLLSRINNENTIFEMDEGEIDEDELFSFSFNKDIFKETEEKPTYSLDIGILLDESGSMNYNMKVAKTALCALMFSFKLIPNINLFIYGHSADKKTGELDIFEYYNTIEQKDDWTSIFNAKSRNNNADGYAIDFMSKVMNKSQANEKLMIVISDGQPSASKYKDGVQHTKSIVEKLEHNGFFIIQLCMDNIENSASMFKHFIPYENGNFYNSLQSLLESKLMKFSEAF